jgi:hypothetical protein
MKVKCYFAACKETIEAPDDCTAMAAGPTATVLAAGPLFGHAEYQSVSIARKVPGRPWVCPYHGAMVGATLGLTPQEEQQRQTLVAQIRAGKMLEAEGGWYEQVPPKPAPEHIIREDDGSIRKDGTMVRWFTQEQMLEWLNDKPRAARGAAYTPPPDGPDAEEANEL